MAARSAPGPRPGDRGARPSNSSPRLPTVCGRPQCAHPAPRHQAGQHPRVQRSCKLADFGLARADSPGGEDQTVTHTGVILGTPSYMSPEQAQGRPCDARSDIFSLGVVLYELVGGRRPFDGRSAVETLQLIANQPAPPLDVSTPGAVRAIVEKALRRTPTSAISSHGKWPLTCVVRHAAVTLFQRPRARSPPGVPRAFDDGFRSRLQYRCLPVHWGSLGGLGRGAGLCCR